MKKLTPRLLWDNAKPSIEADAAGYLIFDDTVLDKRFSQSIELVRRQYSGNEHRVIRGIGLISCLYVNAVTGQFWVIERALVQPRVAMATLDLLRESGWESKFKVDNSSDQIEA